MQTTSKVLFLVESQFTERDYDRFGVETFEEKGINVEVLNLSPVLRPHYFEAIKKSDSYSFKKEVFVESKEDFYKAIIGLDKKTNVICILGPNKDNRFVFSFLEKMKIFYGFLFQGLLPSSVTSNKESSLYSTLKKYLRILIRYQPSPSFVITAGDRASKKAQYNFPKEDYKEVSSFSLDYNIFLGYQDEAKTQKFAVFLDENQPYHPDYVHAQMKPNCESAIYYDELNRFFNFYEEKTGLEIVIAAHPTSEYLEQGNPFSGRKIIKGSTAELVRDCSVSLAHASTSLSFSVLFSKPILLMTSNNYSKGLKEYIRMFGLELDTKEINLSNSVEYRDVDFSFSINKKSYKEYIKNFIGNVDKASLSKNTWEIFIDSIN